MRLSYFEGLLRIAKRKEEQTMQDEERIMGFFDYLTDSDYTECEFCNGEGCSRCNPSGLVYRPPEKEDPKGGANHE